MGSILNPGCLIEVDKISHSKITEQSRSNIDGLSLVNDVWRLRKRPALPPV